MNHHNFDPDASDQFYFTDSEHEGDATLPYRWTVDEDEFATCHHGPVDGSGGEPNLHPAASRA